MRVSYSLMRNLFNPDNCPRAIKYEFIDHLPGRDSKAFMQGRLFEYLLTGSTRDGDKVEYPKGVKGQKLKEELDIEEAAAAALIVLQKMGIDMDKMEKQVHLFDQSDLCHGHIDMIGTDIENNNGQAIYDVKWTATAIDDRWNGWANFEGKANEMMQARHYIYLAHETHGKWMPYYFIVFGKSGWIKIIKCVVDQDSIDRHIRTIQTAIGVIDQMYETGFETKPEYNKCMICPFADKCADASTIPTIEKFMI
jgi:PD-(D/E)XK nuclease superfamily